MYSPSIAAATESGADALPTLKAPVDVQPREEVRRSGQPRLSRNEFAFLGYRTAYHFPVRASRRPKREAASPE